MNDMTMEIDWPVVYINTATNEPLRVITRDEWCGSLAAQYSLSHVTAGQQFFIDSSGQAYRLVGKGFISPGFQIIDPQPADCPDIPRLVRERAQHWLGLSTDSIREIICAATVQKPGLPGFRR
ncbi:MAG: hypothetical protein JW832_01475 [Deltaproteobacteria bacterium]|nr:hypothetical protein [Deltaproteobacteria bacterium]